MIPYQRMITALFNRVPVFVKALIGVALAAGMYYCVLVVGLQNIELVFDPRASTPVSPIYAVKVTRESLQSLFVFGALDTAWRGLQLAEKRIAEAEVLAAHSLPGFTERQLQTAARHQERAAEHIAELDGTTDIDFLRVQYSANQVRIGALSP